MKEIANYQNGTFIVSKENIGTLLAKGFGTKTEEGLILSPEETLYLTEKDWIKPIKDKKTLNPKQLRTLLKIENHQYLVYKDLRSKGYTLKSGLKYGFKYRVYDKGTKIGTEHSNWLLEPVLETQKTSYSNISGKCRIAHSTKKSVVIATIDTENNITYFEMGWKKL